MICSKIYMIVEMCVKCRPDTHALTMAGSWKERVVDETVVYNTKFQIR